MANLCVVIKPVVYHVPGSGTFWLHERVDDAKSSFDVVLEGNVVVWLRVAHGDDGVLDRDHYLSIGEYTSYVRF